MQYMSFTAARDTTKKFFSSTADADYVKNEDIFTIAGRDPSETEKNKAWLTNKLTHLKHYNLVESVYSTGRPRRLEGIRLTHQGKLELGRAVSAPVQVEETYVTNRQPVYATAAVSLDSIARDIIRFEEENPSIALDLSIRIKKGGELAEIKR